jgi:uncharacterized protein YbjT (DUF2867 family)
MPTSILVTGGTGTLGRPVAQRLRNAGASVTVLSRHPREPAEGIRYMAGDLRTGGGIEAAVRGAEVIVHCAGSSKGDEQKTRTLVTAAKDARHIVLISVVGADQIPQASAIDRALFGYFGMKLATEQVVEQSGIGWTTLRATQFHDLILMVARSLARLPVIPASAGSRFQPVDASEVAERMAELALGEPSGLVPDLAGPKIYTLAELVKSYLSAAGKRPTLVPVHWGRRAVGPDPSGDGGPGQRSHARGPGHQGLQVHTGRGGDADRHDRCSHVHRVRPDRHHRVPGLKQQVHQAAIGPFDGNRHVAGIAVAGQPADQRGDPVRGMGRS